MRWCKVNTAKDYGYGIKQHESNEEHKYVLAADGGHEGTSCHRCYLWRYHKQIWLICGPGGEKECNEVILKVICTSMMYAAFEEEKIMC